MRIAVLTTQTPHHAYFVQALLTELRDVHVVLEASSLQPPFETHHPFEALRDRHECDTWFGGRDAHIGDLARTVSFDSINQPEAAAHIASLRPDATVVFGTRKLLAPLIRAAGANLLNLHGGDPEYYRGLDSHLWAIYHEDFVNLVTTLHVLDEALDSGAVVGIRPIVLHRGMRLHQLRQHNTECAVQLTLGALRELRQAGALAVRAQRQAGRYYSFMPAVLKGICVRKFERFCSALA